MERYLIKYFKFDVVKNFALQALNVNDLSKTNKELDEIVEFIKEMN